MGVLSLSANVTRRHATDTRTFISSKPFAQLIQQARLHNEEALVALYQRALPIIYRYVLARVGRADLAEDVVSEVFLTMIEALDDLRTQEEAGFYAWLIQIAQGKVSRALRNLARSHQRSVPLPDSFAASGPLLREPIATDLNSDPVGVQERRETLEEVGQALSKLSEEHQVIVVGRFLGGQSIEELARALGKQPGAVRVSQFRALQALARQLGLGRRSAPTGKGGQR